MKILKKFLSRLFKVNKFNKYNHKELKKEIKSSIIEIMKNTQTDYQSMQSQ